MPASGKSFCGTARVGDRCPRPLWLKNKAAAQAPVATEHATALPRPQAAPSPGSLPLAPPPGCAASSSRCQSRAMQYVRLGLSMQLAWPSGTLVQAYRGAGSSAVPTMHSESLVPAHTVPAGAATRPTVEKWMLRSDVGALRKLARPPSSWERTRRSAGTRGSHGNADGICMSGNASACDRIPIRAFWLAAQHCETQTHKSQS